MAARTTHPGSVKVGRRELLRTAVVAGLTLAIPLLGACRQPPAPSASQAPAAGAVPGVAQRAIKVEKLKPGEAPAWLTGKKYPGQTVTVVSASSGVGALSWKGMAPRWQDATGAQMSFTGFPSNQLAEKIESAVSADVYLADVICYGASGMADYAPVGYLLEVPKYVPDYQKRLDWDDLMPLYAERVLTWAGKLYGIPYDGDIHHLAYREDIMRNPDNASRFKARYGYDWDPDRGPRTWEEYNDMAEFFTGNDWGLGDGVKRLGVIEAMGRKTWSWYWFLDRAAAYAKHPDDPHFFFDPDTMTPRINNPGFVKGLEMWGAVLPYGRPDMINAGGAEVITDFPAGKNALCVDWPNIGTTVYDPERSATVGKVGFNLNPGAKQVWNARTNAWEEFPQINFAPPLWFGGWIISVTKHAKNPEAAFDLALYMGSKETTDYLNPIPSTDVNPSRQGHMAYDIWKKAGFDEKGARQYARAINDTYNHPNAVLDLRIPAAFEYYDQLEEQTSAYLGKKKDAKPALDDAVKAWERITDQMGRAQQKQYYLEGLGITQ